MCVWILTLTAFFKDIKKYLIKRLFFDKLKKENTMKQKTKKISFTRNTSVLDSLKRLMAAVFLQLPWLCAVLGGMGYVHFKAPEWLNHYFKLSVHQNMAFQLQKRLDFVKENISLLNPLHYADYISALSSSTIESTKVTVISQTVSLLINCLDGLLFVLSVIICIYAFFRVLGCWRRKTSENDIANAVVEKLLPLLEEKELIKK